MPIYKLRRHVIYKPGCQETHEVWGIDRMPAALPVRPAPRDTDVDDPLRASDSCGCLYLLCLCNGELVRWCDIAEWMSEAEEAGYTVISGYKDLSPYAIILIRGP